MYVCVGRNAGQTATSYSLQLSLAVALAHRELFRLFQSRRCCDKNNDGQRLLEAEGNVELEIGIYSSITDKLSGAFVHLVLFINSCRDYPIIRAAEETKTTLDPKKTLRCLGSKLDFI
mgnify:CR=1 FL=1